MPCPLLRFSPLLTLCPDQQGQIYSRNVFIADFITSNLNEKARRKNYNEMTGPWTTYYDLFTTLRWLPGKASNHTN